MQEISAYASPGGPESPPAPFPLIRRLLSHKKSVINAGTAGTVALVAWAAFRTGFIDLYPVAVVLGVVVYFLLRVAVEVIELVAETLMPR
ncbi:MAG TPA: hypothetical protein VIP51_08760 [Eoetvoesiella sp.]